MKNQFLLFVFICFFAALTAHQAYPQSNFPKGATPINTNEKSLEIKNTYAVVVGISDYQDPGIPDLRFADKDAEAFANYLRSSAGGKLDGDHMKVLINQQATMAQFANTLDWLWEICKEGDEAIIYFSGHGDVEKKSLTQPGFLLCWDAPAQVYMAGGAFGLPMLQEVISTLSIQNKTKVIVITDACRSGSLAGSSIGGAQATAANLSKQFANEIKILSCQPNEYSVEGAQWGGGRGAFSYHLVDALYGMADNNNDLIVNLQEVGRYLENNVTLEVAPISQVPIIIGNRFEQISIVNDSVLSFLKSGKLNQMKVISAIESKWIEDEVVSKLDSSTRFKYEKFKTTVKNKLFFEPHNDCADWYFIQLNNDLKFKKLHSTIKRNYASALQDDAQQAINIWLKADVQQLECIGTSLRLEPIANQLGRAAELLGENHYMYRSLQARRFLFESILLIKDRNPDEILGHKCISLLQKSLKLEEQSPLTWHRMSMIYAYKLLNPDSAFYCAHQSNKFAPKWVLPFADLAYVLYHQNKLVLAQNALEQAEHIDSLHPYVLNRLAGWYDQKGGMYNWKKAVSLFEKYQTSGAPLYPCWYNGYGNSLRKLGFFDQAEQVFMKAIDMDSTNIAILTSLGILYNESEQYSKAEPFLKRAIRLDSDYTYAYDNLGLTYHSLGKYKDAENNYLKAISLDSTLAGRWVNLGYLYYDFSRMSEAEIILKKAIELDSSNFEAWNTLALLYMKTQNFKNAETALLNCIKLDSSYVVSWNNLGSFYVLTQKFVEAEQALNKAIALDSTFANPFKHLGMSYFKTNRFIEAKHNLIRALELKSNYTGAMLGLACLNFAEGNTEEAFGFIERAIGKGITLEQLVKDEDLTSLRSTPEWKSLMKKHFPDKFKE